MRDPARIDRILGLLRKAWKKEPSMRLGQLLVSVTPRQHPQEIPRSMFYIEDDEWEKWLRDCPWVKK